MERARTGAEQSGAQVPDRPDGAQGVHQQPRDDGPRLRVRAALRPRGRPPAARARVLGGRGPVLRPAGREAGGRGRHALGRGQSVQEGLGPRRPPHALRPARRAVPPLLRAGKMGCLAVVLRQQRLLLPQRLALLYRSRREAETAGCCWCRRCKLFAAFVSREQGVEAR